MRDSRCGKQVFQWQLPATSHSVSGCPCRTISFYNKSQKSASMLHMPEQGIYTFPLCLFSDAQLLIFHLKDLPNLTANQKSNRNKRKILIGTNWQAKLNWCFDWLLQHSLMTQWPWRCHSVSPWPSSVFSVIAAALLLVWGWRKWTGQKIDFSNGNISVVFE